MKNNKKTKIIAYALAVCMIFNLAVVFHTENADAATKLAINLTNNQTFYFLPGTTDLNYQVKITAGGATGSMKCTSSNTLVATIDDFGNLHLTDAGSTKITVKSGSKKVTKTINVLNRSDWTKALTINNYNKIVAQNNVLTVKLKNNMDFPIEIQYAYDVYDDNGALRKSDEKSEVILLGANKSLTYKTMVPNECAFIKINGCSFVYDQFGYQKINEKNVTMKESTKKDKNDKTIRYKVVTLKNKNKYKVRYPYHLYIYDNNNQLVRVEYRIAMIPAKTTIELEQMYFSSRQFEKVYDAKVKYVFDKMIPNFAN